MVVPEIKKKSVSDVPEGQPRDGGVVSGLPV